MRRLDGRANSNQRPPSSIFFFPFLFVSVLRSSRSFSFDPATSPTPVLLRYTCRARSDQEEVVIKVYSVEYAYSKPRQIHLSPSLMFILSSCQISFDVYRFYIPSEKLYFFVKFKSKVNLFELIEEYVSKTQSIYSFNFARLLE